MLKNIIRPWGTHREPDENTLGMMENEKKPHPPTQKEKNQDTLNTCRASH
jgi:hypothetical protein